MNLKPEEQLQASIVQYVKFYPDWFLHHSPNENKLYSSVLAKSRAILIAKNQKLGVKSGYPDLILHGPNGKCCLIELKHGNNKLSENQIQVRDWMKAHNHEWFLIKTLDEFIELFTKLRNE